MSTAKNHHYVPQFYLRRWARAPGKKLWRYSRIQHTGKLDEQDVSPKSTGSEDELYTLRDAIPFLNAAPPDIIETEFFGEIDDAAAIAMSALIDGNALTGEQKTAWARFLASLFHRGAHVLLEKDKIGPELVRQVYAQMMGMPKTDESATRMREILDSMDQLGVASNTAREHMVKEINDPALSNYLESCEWRVFSVPPQYALITSDRPLLVNPGSTKKTPIEMITLALSPERLLLLYTTINGDFESEEQLRQCAASLILVHNFLHAQSEAKYLYAHQQLADNERSKLRTFVESKFGIESPGS